MNCWIVFGSGLLYVKIAHHVFFFICTYSISFSVVLDLFSIPNLVLLKYYQLVYNYIILIVNSSVFYVYKFVLIVVSVLSGLRLKFVFNSLCITFSEAANFFLQRSASYLGWTYMIWFSINIKVKLVGTVVYYNNN